MNLHSFEHEFLCWWAVISLILWTSSYSLEMLHKGTFCIVRLFVSHFRNHSKKCFGNEDCVGQTEDTRLLTVFISDRKLVCPRQMSELPLRALTVHIVIHFSSSVPLLHKTLLPHLASDSLISFWWGAYEGISLIHYFLQRCQKQSLFDVSRDR